MFIASYPVSSPNPRARSFFRRSPSRVFFGSTRVLIRVSASLFPIEPVLKRYTCHTHGFPTVLSISANGDSVQGANIFQTRLLSHDTLKSCMQTPMFGMKLLITSILTTMQADGSRVF